MLMESVFSLADVYFVSRIGMREVAVVGITEALLTLVYALAMGIGIAATAVVARRIGEGRPDQAAREGVQAIWLGVIVSLAVGGAGFVWPAELLVLMGADPVTAAAGTGYARVILAGNLVIVLLFVNNALLCGAGDASVAMRSLWLANGLNLLLDPCLIFGVGPCPALGLEGAAWATVFGRGSAVGYQLWKLCRGSGRLKVRARHLPLRPRGVWRMTRISVGAVG